MNRIRPGSFLVNMADGIQLDVFEEIRKTKNVPFTHTLGPAGTLGCIEFSGEVFDDIRRYIQYGGYAGVSLADYLDGLYSRANCNSA